MFIIYLLQYFRQYISQSICLFFSPVSQKNFFLNKIFLKYTRLLKKITVVAVAVMVFTTAPRLRLRLSNKHAVNHGCGYSIHH